MKCLAGVDEAGLGPILGPLVVAGVAMRGPAAADPWRVLSDLVSRRRAERGKVRVADSKKVHSGPKGLSHVERTALTFWAVLRGELPRTLRDWLRELGADRADLRRCPWYEGIDLALPLENDADWLRLTAEQISRRLRREGIELQRISIRPVDVEEWNRWIAETDNKSLAHFRAYAEVLSELIATLGDGGHLVADRCGGRIHYARDLARLVPGVRVETDQERPEASTYRLIRETAEARVTFAERAEDRAFPTALASCFAKYVRELMMRVLNDWFAAKVPGLARTAGYFVDGRRFLEDLEPHLGRLALPYDRLVRCR
ncbi:MAG: hypothetical protein Fur0037_20010 [Planctomycetota bacterium]